MTRDTGPAAEDAAALAALAARIEAFRGERGFLLPHHPAMAIAAPDLHEAYVRMYRALTVDLRHLDAFEREVVWLAILIAAEEAIGTHHVELFFRHGGREDQARALTGLVGFALGAEAHRFMDEKWAAHFPSLAGTAAYRQGFDALAAAAPLPIGLCHLAAAAAQAVRRRDWGLAAHVEAAYGHGVAEDALVEALSLVIWPAGVNAFLEACGVWKGLMDAGRVVPSPRYRVWADTAAQGGHAERGDDAERGDAGAGGGATDPQ